jgi:predicted transcriptional regulator
MANRNADVEAVIIQGLGNKERRNILKVIKLAKDGAIYSEIMGELELNSGSLNYHLRQLEGLIAKNVEGRYMLTPLGEKALRGLYSMTENLENGYEEYLNRAKVRQKRTSLPTLAGIVTIIASCLSAFLGIIGTGMSVSLVGVGAYFANRLFAWLLIAVFAALGFAIGLSAGIFSLKRKRFVFSLIGMSLLLVPGIASVITFLVTGTTTGWLFALFLGSPVVVSSIVSVIFISKSKGEFD